MEARPHKAWTLFAVVLLICTALLTPVNARSFAKENDAVRLEDINALTFYTGRETTHRRVPAIPQLTCISGSGCGHFEPDSIRCTNSGSSYDASSVEWTCRASLPPEFKLGSTEVVCEGYDNSDDPFVLKGSCALEYRLLLTDLGHDRYGGSGDGFWNDGSTAAGGTGATAAAVVFWAIFAGVASWILYSLYQAIRRPNQNRDAPPDDTRRGWRGGWDDDGDDDPPPPYAPYRDTASSARQSNAQHAKSAGSKQAGSSRASSSRTTSNRSQQSQQRPWWQSFGAGAAAGGLAGYMAGNSRSSTRNRDEATREQEGRRSFFSTMGRPSTSDDGPSRSFFGGPSGSGSRQSSFGRHGPPNFSTDRYESTGFGGSRRR